MIYVPHVLNKAWSAKAQTQERKKNICTYSEEERVKKKTQQQTSDSLSFIEQVYFTHENPIGFTLVVVKTRLSPITGKNRLVSRLLFIYLK